VYLQFGKTEIKLFGVLNGGLLLSAVMPPDDKLAREYGVNARLVDGLPSAKIVVFGTDLIKKSKIKLNISEVIKLEEAAQARTSLSRAD
jgi:hypothetical protein